MESLDRNILNIEIVRLRRDIQRATITALRKLVRKVEQLRSKKGTEQARAKNEKKAERLVQEMQELKKIKADEVSKFAFANNEKGCIKIIANPDSLTHTKCLARIASEKIVTSKIKSLGDKYYNWGDALMFLQPAVKKKKSKTESKDTSKKTDSTRQLEYDESKDDEVEDGSEEETSSIVSDEDDSEQENSSSAESDNDRGSSSSPQPQIMTVKLKKTKVKEIKVTEQKKVKKPNETGKHEDKGNKVNAKHKETKGTNDKKKVVPTVKPASVSSGVAVVRRITNLEDLEQLETLASNVKSSGAAETRKDSFFLSADGEEVESEEEDQEESSSESEGEELEQGPNRVYHGRGKEEPQERRRTFATLNKQEIKTSWKSNQNHPSLKRFDKIQPQKKAPPPAKGKFFKEPVHSKPEVSEKLHPSWEAKRKQKEAIQIGSTPQNKKIKFDD